MTFPKRPHSHVTGDRAVQIFKDACEPSWVVADVVRDYGLDLRIELTEGDEVTGQEIHVQVKGRSQTVNEIPTVEVRQTTVNYWLAKLTPILIALVDTTIGTIWYDWLENAYAAYPKQRKMDSMVRLKLSNSTIRTPLANEITRYSARFFGQLWPMLSNLFQRARLTEMLFHVVSMTHLFYDLWFYVDGMPRTGETTAEVQDKLRLFYQEFGTHDAFLQLPWRHFVVGSPSPLVLEAFESRFSAYEKIKKTFFAPGQAQHEYEEVPLVGGGHEPPGTLRFIPLRLQELILAIGPSIHVLRDIEGLIFRILLLGRLKFLDK